MAMNLLPLLPQLEPKAIAWAESLQAHAFRVGQALSVQDLELARNIGVIRPERIRVAEVTSLPLPGDADLRAAATQTGLMSDQTIGMSFGYGIYIRQGELCTRLLSHEFRHVYQYEQAGSLAKFISEYMLQIITLGYARAPLEIDALDHQVDHA